MRGETHVRARGGIDARRAAGAKSSRNGCATLVDRLLGADGVQGQRLKAAGITGGRDVTLGDLPLSR